MRRREFVRQRFCDHQILNCPCNAPGRRTFLTEFETGQAAVKAAVQWQCLHATFVGRY